MKRMILFTLTESRVRDVARVSAVRCCLCHCMQTSIVKPVVCTDGEKGLGVASRTYFSAGGYYNDDASTLT